MPSQQTHAPRRWTDVSLPLLDSSHTRADLETCGLTMLLAIRATYQRIVVRRGLLKHVGCGANAAFMSLPAQLRLRPVVTGWLADDSVLAPGSRGLRWHDKVCHPVSAGRSSDPSQSPCPGGLSIGQLHPQTIKHSTASDGHTNQG